MKAMVLAFVLAALVPTERELETRRSMDVLSEAKEPFGFLGETPRGEPDSAALQLAEELLPYVRTDLSPVAQ